MRSPHPPQGLQRVEVDTTARCPPAIPESSRAAAPRGQEDPNRWWSHSRHTGTPEKLDPNSELDWRQEGPGWDTLGTALTLDSGATSPSKRGQPLECQGPDHGPFPEVPGLSWVATVADAVPGTIATPCCQLWEDLSLGALWLLPTTQPRMKRMPKQPLVGYKEEFGPIPTNLSQPAEWT